MKRFLLFVAIELLFSTAEPQAVDFGIAAFNLDTFGRTKSSKANVVEIIANIVHRYDIIMLHSIRDNSGDAMETLMTQINSQENTRKYEIVQSEPLGRSDQKFAFLWRNMSNLELIDTFQYDISSMNFNRAPFSALFRLKEETDVYFDFALMAAQSPTGPVADVVNEANALVYVHDEISQLWNTGNILIMGDLSADCEYLSEARLNDLTLRTDGRFNWLIGDDEDTATSLARDCAFNRFVMSGSEFVQIVIAGSAKAFRFDEEYGLTEDEAEDVSRRYPIEINLGNRGSPTESPTESPTVHRRCHR